MLLKKYAQLGFSLIEILFVMTLSSLLIATLLQGMSFLAKNVHMLIQHDQKLEGTPIACRMVHTELLMYEKCDGDSIPRIQNIGSL